MKESPERTRFRYAAADDSIRSHFIFRLSQGKKPQENDQ
jgi:hypothetical protein